MSTNGSLFAIRSIIWLDRNATSVLPVIRSSVVIPFDFLICSERSGSNLITKLLDAHPQVCGPSPFHIFRASVPHLYRYGDLSTDRNWHILLKDIVDLYHKMIARWKYPLSREQLEKAVAKHSLVEVIHWIFEKEMRVNGKERIFVKENQSYTLLPFFLTYFTHSKFIFLVRNPRDMASEWKMTGPLPGQVRTAARQWRIDQKRSLQAFGFLKDLNRIHLVKFEQLLQNTVTTLEEICAFLGIDYSEQMLDFHRNEMTVVNAWQQRAWADLQQPIMPDNVGIFRSRLSEPEILYIEALCGEEMAQLGYSRDFTDNPGIETLDQQLPPESLQRIWNEQERFVFPPFLEAMDRFRNRALHK